MEKTITIDIPLLAPELPDVRDSCLTYLETALQNRKGILHAHVREQEAPPQLCLHYDPALISLGAVHRLAQEAGTDFTNRYRHETIPFAGMDAADAAASLAQVLEELPGMLHASVNYAAALIFVAYDTQMLQSPDIMRTIRGQGYRHLAGTAVLFPAPQDAERDHGGGPAFLPEWVRQRWTLILVALAGLFLLLGWAGETFFGLPQNVALFFYILSYIFGGYEIATHAVPGLLKGQFDTDVLMLAAAGGAAVLGEWAEGAFLLFLFSLGHAGEHYALDRARSAVNALGELMPATARVRVGETIVERPVEEVAVGDVVLVRPGDRIPVDGEIARGSSTIDQSAITGESLPVTRSVGEQVFAGTINQENSLDVRATSLAQDNTLSRVLQMVAEAQEQQSPTQQFTQRFTAWFVPAVLLLVALVVVVPPLLGWMPLEDSFYRAMLLLVAASPCALALGTPAAVLAGVAQAARHGVLIKGGAHLENLGRVEVMAFDKTGTLTAGRFAVTDIVPLNGTAVKELLALAAAVEQGSNHPLAQAVVAAAVSQSLTLPAADGLQNVPGQGVISMVDGREVRIGALELLAAGVVPDDAAERLAALQAGGKTTMAVSADGRLLGLLALADETRAGVPQTMADLRDLGIQHLVLLTGDNEVVAQRVGQAAGFTDVRADLLPGEKLNAVRELQETYGLLAMTGDGVNDAPALAAADVGIAMGGAGTAVALETADVALMADDLSRLPFAVGLSRAARRIIIQNLAIALGVIGLLLLTSVTGLLALSGTVILHEGSTLVVVLNALRLLRYQEG